MGGGRSKYGWTYGSKKYKEIKAKLKIKSASRDQDDNTNDETRNAKFTDFGAYNTAVHNSTNFFYDDTKSNTKDWLDNLTPAEKKAIQGYTAEDGIDYTVINKNLYTKNWDDIPSNVQDRIKSMDSAFNKALLLEGIQVTRQCDFQIFGAAKGKKMSIDQIKAFIKKEGIDNVLENKGYLSFGANNHGAGIAGTGLVIHAKVPPSRGAGAYVNPISTHAGASENEYLFNRGSNFKYDLKSLHVGSDGKVHINATWVPGKKKRKK